MNYKYSMNIKKHKSMIEAYEHMLEQVHELFSTVEDKVRPKLSHAIETAQQKTYELGKLTQDEAEKVGEYLKRDLKDMGHYLDDTGKELREWFKFDLEVMEDKLEDMLVSAADKTSLEIKQLKERLTESATWHTGEITAPGTLVCEKCGQEIHFQKTAHIPPCPKCHGSNFKRSR